MGSVLRLLLVCLFYDLATAEKGILEDGIDWFTDSKTSLPALELEDKGLGSLWSAATSGIPRYETCADDELYDSLFKTPEINIRDIQPKISWITITTESQFNFCGGGIKKCKIDSTVAYLYQGTTKLNKSNSAGILDKLPYSYNITNRTLGRQNDTFSFPVNNTKPVKLLLRSIGSCVDIFRMTVSYFYCNETFISGIYVNQTASPRNGTKQVTGKCSKNSSNSTSGPLSLSCTSHGDWSYNKNISQYCECDPGYGENETMGCQRCDKSYYKPSNGSKTCLRCPSNADSFENRTACYCKEGFYELDENPLSCYGLPKLNGGIQLRANDSLLNLTWMAVDQNVPNDSIEYVIKIFVCDSLDDFSSCEEKQEETVVETYFVFTATKKKYLFRVYPKNKVNELVDESKWQYSEITFDNEDGGDNPNGEPYIVYYIIGAIALCIILLAAIIILLLRQKRRKKKRSLDNGGYDNFAMRNASLRQNYIDPNTYEDPEEAVLQFASELDQSAIFIENLIGGGEFGDVYKGIMEKEGEKIPVAIKALKATASEKDNKDFLLEASMLGQFKNQNIVRLEGVVTKSLPRMIVLEFIANGSLDNYLKSNSGLLTPLQLIGMAKGVAGGMEYLAAIGFVHRDLAARNVLVNERLLCKIADFGLSRELENTDTSCGEYATTGGKIPIRWTAPEAITMLKFSSASDVWSYGILLWEIFSFAERPYGGWDNYKVVEQVGEGYRLPAPEHCPKGVHELMLFCWRYKRSERPSFYEVNVVVDKWIRSPETMSEAPDMGVALEKWLRDIKMERYIDLFKEKGYKVLPDLYEMTDEILINMGIRPVGHRHKIIKQLDILKELRVGHYQRVNDLI